ncbi:YtxH domain-containing protein [Streptomyces sp. NPDC046727]|uniref:YtxH domain-containing protein n=1 Tax=Streptomyces sp. NPDC046727 TaxID=3155373 RepID=UPI0033D3014D
MEREHAPGPERGLSTEDLAQPRAGSRGEPRAQSEAPVYPGESTAPPQETAEGQGREAAAVPDDESLHLLAPEEEEHLRERWQEIQNEFIDDPQDAVHTADSLVADVMQQLAETFSEQKHELEGQWNRGEEADTEDLRRALQHYRSFFNRLLTA